MITTDGIDTEKGIFCVDTIFFMLSGNPAAGGQEGCPKEVLSRTRGGIMEGERQNRFRMGEH